ncbi:hypothetical protein Q5752_004222 [Cryptotrichosporon argae]
MPPLPLVRLQPNAVVHRFGAPASAPRSSALLRFGKEGWTIGRDGREGWAIVGDAEGRRLAVEALSSRHRIEPSSPSPFPSTSTAASTSTSSRPIRHLAFARPPVSGDFTDFTARYGALQEEDRVTVRESLLALTPAPSGAEIEAVAARLGIAHLLDLPVVSCSSGQTRRARIAAALLTRPALLLLEDPMAGLDAAGRAEVARVLGEINDTAQPRIALVLRAGTERMPDWITHVAEVRAGDVWVGTKGEWKGEPGRVVDDSDDVQPQGGEAVVRLQDVSVSYGEGTRPVLKNVSWEIRPGDRWHLQGSNGSGKTTLLSLVLGHHPRSFSLPASSLTLFARPRRSTPTPRLRQLIGHASPEVFAAFPRGMGLSALAAVGTGFDGVFSRRDLEDAQKRRVLALLDAVAPLLRPARPEAPRSPADPARGGLATEFAQSTIDIARRPFAHCTPPQQALLLFLRAIVARPPLLVLDEPSQGMDEDIWAACRAVLEREWAEMRAEGTEQAVVVVSHYEEEVPWSRKRGKILRLTDGVASEP